MNLPTARSWIAGLTQRLRRPNRRQPTASTKAGHSAVKRVYPSELQRVSARLGIHRVNVVARRNTTDGDLVKMILCRDSAYRLPPSVNPQVIFDVGANIGITAVYFALTYPHAQIYCFEPLPQNLELLRTNTQPWSDRVHVIPYGLSDKNGRFDYHMSDNPASFGGGGFNRIGHDPARKLVLPTASVPQALAGLNVDRVDVFKIDTEGSEWAILRSIPDHIRASAQAYIGELHGIGDWFCCHILDPTHTVGVQKRFDRRCFPFVAIRRDLAHQPKLLRMAA